MTSFDPKSMVPSSPAEIAAVDGAYHCAGRAEPSDPIYVSFGRMAADFRLTGEALQRLLSRHNARPNLVLNGVAYFGPGAHRAVQSEIDQETQRRREAERNTLEFERQAGRSV